MALHNIPDADYKLDLSRGLIPKFSILHKFGRNKEVGTTYAPVCIGGVYQTPQVSGATPLRIRAGNVNDTALGSGARSVTLQGLNASGQEITETIATAGASNSAATSNSFLRLYRAFVASSGTYASATAGSHAADIIIENSSGGTAWATIDLGNFPKGQTEIAVYTVPLGFQAYINNINISVESTKAASVLLFQRRNILETAAPYTAVRLVADFNGVSGALDISDESPQGPFPALTDIGFMSRVTAGTAIVSANFEIILESTS